MGALETKFPTPLQRGRATGDLRISVKSLHGLFRIAASDYSKVSRVHLTQNGKPDTRVTGEDLQALAARGYVAVSKHWIEMTDQGNAFVRELVKLANSKGEGDGV